jgi:tryptophanyl-tRNA synthetase
MSKPVILTGLRATNDIHIGNYFGAVLPLIDMARHRSAEYDVHLFVADLHSVTTPLDHAQFYSQIISNLKSYVAAGLPLDNESVYLYRQSYISAHSELTWLLDCFTGFGEMGRMTQFKDKSAKLQEDRISVGLYHYPVLMSADILLYNATYVPVGDDQSQHLEFARDIAQRMNSHFGEIFTVPESVPKQHAFFGKDQGLRIRDLVDPAKKMSKSDETGRGVIFLSDTPQTATKKIMSAATDSFGEIRFDVKERPGISNLLQILALLAGRDQKEVITEWEGKTSYGDLKKAVAEVVSNFLRDFQSKLAGVDDQTLLAKLEKDEAAMRGVANETLLRTQRAVGLRPQHNTEA